MAAPLGNKNAAKAKVWTAAIERALERRGSERGKAIDEIADKLLSLCMDGDLGALKQLGDRLEGKPAQAISMQDVEGASLITEIKWTFGRKGDDQAA
jgi:hypothetical protein